MIDMPSANGQAFAAYLDSARAALGGLTSIAYYQQPLPSPVDSRLAEIVSAFSGLPPAGRERFMAALTPPERALFGVFGHRAATLSVRDESLEQLRLGLIAAAIANYDIPEKRDVDVALAVFYHCARKLGAAPREVFDEASEFATADMAGRMRAFGRRDDVSLKRYGWREIRTPEGVRYKFEWR